MATSKSQLKQWFENGDIPTEAQFAALIDAFRHVDTIIQQAEVNGLITALSGKLGTNKLVTDTASNTTTEVFTTSAVQAIVGNLQTAINNLNALLTSDDSTLDELQEVVDFIKQNKEDLQNLTIANIAGLQAALDAKLSGTAASTADILAGTVGAYVAADKLQAAKDSQSFHDSQSMIDATTTDPQVRLHDPETGNAIGKSSVRETVRIIDDNDLVLPCTNASDRTTALPRDHQTEVSEGVFEDTFADQVAYREYINTNFFTPENNNEITITPLSAGKAFGVGARFAEAEFLYWCLDTTNVISRFNRGGSASDWVSITLPDTTTVTEIRDDLPLVAGMITRVLRNSTEYRVTNVAPTAITVQFDPLEGTLTFLTSATGDETIYIKYIK